MGKIRVAIVGVGNCASSLIQGLSYYLDKTEDDAIGLMNWDIGGYKPFDVEVVSAFDVDRRKVGKSLKEAIFALTQASKRNKFSVQILITNKKTNREIKTDSLIIVNDLSKFTHIKSTLLSKLDSSSIAL